MSSVTGNLRAAVDKAFGCPAASLQFAVIEQNGPVDVMQDTGHEMMSQP